MQGPCIHSRVPWACLLRHTRNRFVNLLLRTESLGRQASTLMMMQSCRPDCCDGPGRAENIELNICTSFKEPEKKGWDTHTHTTRLHPDSEIEPLCIVFSQHDFLRVARSRFPANFLLQFLGATPLAWFCPASNKRVSSSGWNVQTRPGPLANLARAVIFL